MELVLFFAREKGPSKQLTFVHVPPSAQYVDILTKYLTYNI